MFEEKLNTADIASELRINDTINEIASDIALEIQKGLNKIGNDSNIYHLIQL